MRYWVYYWEFSGGEVKRCSHLILIVEHFSYNFTWHWYVDCYLFSRISFKRAFTKELILYENLEFSIIAFSSGGGLLLSNTIFFYITAILNRILLCYPSKRNTKKCDTIRYFHNKIFLRKNINKILFFVNIWKPYYICQKPCDEFKSQKKRLWWKYDNTLNQECLGCNKQINCALNQGPKPQIIFL